MNIDSTPASTDVQPQDLQSGHRPTTVAPGSASHRAPINILIVDDDPKNLTVLETVLDNPGYRLVRAESADQALHALLVEEFALLILDVRLPGMTGFELAHMIRERKKTAGVPILFLTAYYDDDQHILEGYKTGGVDYLLKPVNPTILRSKVAVFAELYNTNRTLLAEVNERRQAVEQLRELNATLERRVSERTASLHRSEARYRELVQALPAAIYTTDERGRITLYNTAAVTLWGHEPEIGGDPLCGPNKIYRPDGTPLPMDESPMAVTLREGRAIRGEEIVIERPNGTRRHVLPYSEPLYTDDGVVVVGAVNMLIDVSELRQAERDMAHLAAIVRTTEDAIVSKNLQGTVTSWNGGAERLFGYTAEEMIGQPVSRLIPPERLNEEPRILERIRRGEAIEHYETIRRRKDGTEVPVSLAVSPLFDHAGKVIGASKIARNITEQKRVEEALKLRDRTLTTINDALKEQTLALAEANKELEGFSYSVSHDLRAPLRTIDAFSRIVEEDHGPSLNAEARRCLTIIRKSATDAGQMIEDLLNFSRLGRLGMQFQSVRMTGLARETADNLLRLMPEDRKIDLTIGDLPPCRGDHRLILLVWTNLLSNAFKYTKYREAARIEVDWLPDNASPEAVTYYVKDNGIGFNMQYVHKLFGVFQRLHHKEEFEGTGVGLATVQRIIQRHGGRLWAEGKVDGGATFFFSLRKATAC